MFEAAVEADTALRPRADLICTSIGRLSDWKIARFQDIFLIPQQRMR